MAKVRFDRSKTLNMTEGSTAKLLAVFALPMLIGNIFQQAYNLVDSVIVGQYIGAHALAAVGAANSVSFLFFSICNGLGSGCGIVTSQYFGAGDPNRVRRAIANSAYIMFASAIVMAVIAYSAAQWVLGLMGTPAEIFPNAVAYMRISCMGVPLIATYNYASSMLRALGDSRTPLYILIFSCFLNILLDLLCVYVLGMGVVGAAVATIAAQLISGVGCLFFAVRGNPYFMLSREDMKLDLSVVKAASRLGFPLAMQWSLIAVSSTALQTFANSFGAAAAAAFTATVRFEQLLYQPYGSLSAAMSTYAGQNLGAGKMSRIRGGLKTGSIMALAFTALIFSVNQLFADKIISIFVSDAEVIAIGGTALRLTSWFYIFLAAIYMVRGILNGVGDALFAFINGIVEVITRSCLPMLMVMIPTVGIWGIWWTVGLTWMISAVFCFLRYVTWKRRHYPKTNVE